MIAVEDDRYQMEQSDMTRVPFDVSWPTDCGPRRSIKQHVQELLYIVYYTYLIELIWWNKRESIYTIITLYIIPESLHRYNIKFPLLST